MARSLSCQLPWAIPLDELFRIADMNMYSDKRNTKNSENKKHYFRLEKR